MALDVNVTITLSEAGGAVGFGVPLILVSKADSEIAYAEYASIAEVQEAGYAIDSAAYQAFTIMKGQDSKPRYIAIAQTTKTAVEALPDYENKVRQVITLLGTEDSTMAQVAAYIEASENLLYFPVVTTAEELEPFAGLDRTMAGVHSEVTTQALAAALVGATAGYDAGSFTYKNIILKGVAPDDITDGDVRNINNETGTNAAYGYTVQTKAGDMVTTEGKTAGGEFMDIVDCFDWIIKNIGTRSQKLLNTSKKLPYDNRGIASLEGVTNGVLREADRMGMIAHDDAGDPQYSTDFGTRDEATAADRSARSYKLGRFSFDLAGAIHTATINGTAVV